MKVVKVGRVPVYEMECPECHSVLQFTTLDIEYPCIISCPVCGKSCSADLSNRIDEEDT